MMRAVPFQNFESSCRAVLAYLREHIRFDLWMMTKTVGDDWIVLHAEDHGYNVKEGTVFRWCDSYCALMVQGNGPRVAPQAQRIDLYATASINQQVPIGAYMGVPVVNSDGTLFGTLCAIDPSPMPESIVDSLPLVELQAKFLGTVLACEKNAIERDRLLNICRGELSTDVTTQLLNRRGWENSIVTEEARVQRYGGHVSIFMLDIDNLKLTNDAHGHAQGDELIRRTASCVRRVLRDSDIVARLGGDEFAVIALECDRAGAEVLLTKITRALKSDGLHASVGKATREPQGGLITATHQADLDMFAAKAARKSNHPF